MKEINKTLNIKLSKTRNVLMILALSSASVNALANPLFSQDSYEVKPSSSDIQSNTTVDRNTKINDQLSEYSDAQLDQMLAPIALYPDSLLTHVLIAATYPLEIVQADRWLSKSQNKNLNTEKLLKRVSKEGWDPSVQALSSFPNVVERMSNNLDWTQQLGEAFLQSESRVLSSIQSLRNKALEAGNLTQMDNVNVSYEDSNIIIQPIEREVVYVPYYDTRVVFGDWHWRHNPPVFWVNRHHHFKPYHGLFSWNTGVRLSFNVLFGSFHWRDHHVVVHHRDKYRGYRQHSYDRPSKRWQHDRKHRRGVVYRNVKLNKHFNKSHHDIKGKKSYSVDGRRSPDKYQRINQHLTTAKVTHHKGHGKLKEKSQAAHHYKDKKRANNKPVHSARSHNNKTRHEVKPLQQKSGVKKHSGNSKPREVKKYKVAAVKQYKEKNIKTKSKGDSYQSRKSVKPAKQNRSNKHQSSESKKHRN